MEELSKILGHCGVSPPLRAHVKVTFRLLFIEGPGQKKANTANMTVP